MFGSTLLLHRLPATVSARIREHLHGSPCQLGPTSPPSLADPWHRLVTRAGGGRRTRARTEGSSTRFECSTAISTFVFSGSMISPTASHHPCQHRCGRRRSFPFAGSVSRNRLLKARPHRRHQRGSRDLFPRSDQSQLPVWPAAGANYSRGFATRKAQPLLRTG